MKQLIFIVLLYFFTVPGFSKENTLAKELAVFQPYLGTWQSQFQFSADQPEVTDVSRWERALNGTAVRTLHSVNDGDYGGESLIFL